MEVLLLCLSFLLIISPSLTAQQSSNLNTSSAVTSSSPAAAVDVTSPTPETIIQIVPLTASHNESKNETLKAQAQSPYGQGISAFGMSPLPPQLLAALQRRQQLLSQQNPGRQITPLDLIRGFLPPGVLQTLNPLQRQQLQQQLLRQQLQQRGQAGAGGRNGLLGNNLNQGVGGARRSSPSSSNGGEDSSGGGGEDESGDGGNGGSEDGGNGGEEQSNPQDDPDLKQLQNLQNGGNGGSGGGDNFPAGLFPPGILSASDIKDIEKGIEDQRRKEEEDKRREQEEQAAREAEEAAAQEEANEKENNSNQNNNDASNENSDPNNNHNHQPVQQGHQPGFNQQQNQNHIQNQLPAQPQYGQQPQPHPVNPYQPQIQQQYPQPLPVPGQYPGQQVPGHQQLQPQPQYPGAYPQPQVPYQPQPVQPQQPVVQPGYPNPGLPYQPQPTLGPQQQLPGVAGYPVVNPLAGYPISNPTPGVTQLSQHQLNQMRGVNPAILSQLNPQLLNQLSQLQRNQLGQQVNLNQLLPHQINQLHQLQQLNQLRNQQLKNNGIHPQVPASPPPPPPAYPPAHNPYQPPVHQQPALGPPIRSPNHENNQSPVNNNSPYGTRIPNAYPPTTNFNPYRPPGGQNQQQGLLPVLGNIVRGAGRALGFPLDGGSGSSNDQQKTTPSPAQVRQGYRQQEPQEYDRSKDYGREGSPYSRPDDRRSSFDDTTSRGKAGVDYEGDDRSRSPYRDNYNKQRDRAPEHRERGSYDYGQRRPVDPWSPRIEKPVVDAYTRDREHRQKELRSGVDYGVNDVEEDDRVIRYRGGGFRGRDDERDRGRGTQERVRFRDEAGQEIGHKEIPSSRYPPSSRDDPTIGRRKSPYDDDVSDRLPDRRANPYLIG